MIFKYTSRLIKSTFNRFLAILAIVFIGVSFMMGLLSNYDIMQESVEDYLDESKLYDVQIYSNYGFDENDIKAINNLEYVDEVFASKTRDVYANEDDGDISVVRVLELDSNLNKINLVEGRMPEKENECLIYSGYSRGSVTLGDKLSLFLEDEEIEDSLKNKTYIVVGKVESCEYMPKTFAPSLLDNNDLNCVIYIENSNFVFDYDTSLFLSIKDARELNSFKKEYEDLIDEKVDSLKDFASSQSNNLKESIVNDAKQELQDAKDELEENRIKYDKELADAKQELIDAKKELDDAYQEILEGKKELIENEAKLKDANKKLNEALTELNEKEKELKDAEDQFASFGKTVEELQPLVSQANSMYKQAVKDKTELENQKLELENDKEIAEGIVASSIYANSNEVQTRLDELNPVTDELEYQQLTIELNAFKVLEGYNASLNSINQSLMMKNMIINGIKTSIENQYGISVDQLDFLETSINQIIDGKKQISDGYKTIEENKKLINNGFNELEEGKTKLEDGIKEFEDGKIKYNDGLKEYEDGVKEYEDKMVEANDKIADAEEKLNDLDEAKWTILKRYDSNHSTYMYRNTCEQMRAIGISIPLLFFIVAALVCATTMTRLIDEQRSQIGIYRALGFKNNEIKEIYLLYVVLASLIASLIAIFVGLMIFPYIIYTTWRLMYILPPIKIIVPIDNLIICTLAFGLLMVIVSMIVLNKSLKECPAQLLRPKAPRSTKQILLEKVKWVWSKFTFTTKVTARNIFRYKARFIMTIIGVAGCTSLLLMGWGIKDSISSVMTLQYEDIYKYNYSVNLKNDRHINEIINEINKDENNELCVPFTSYNTKLNHDNDELTIGVVVIDSNKEDQVYKLEDYKTKKIVDLEDDGIIITEKFAKKNKIKVGDEVIIHSKTDEDIIGKVTVKAITVNYVSNFIYISEAQYKKLFNETIEYNTIAVINNNDISNLMSLQEKFADISSIKDFEGEIARFNDMIEALNYIILIIIVVAGALAFVVLINLTNVNISERIREIATLKVLGFREHEVNSYIFKEVLLMSFVGALIGLPLGKVEERFIMTVIDMDICMFPHVVKPISYVYAFVITIIFTVIVLLLTRKTLRKVEMVESLKSIE